ncbi:MAG: hypothetical protein Q9180_006143, partial [Flavoplaca navasiana]
MDPASIFSIIAGSAGLVFQCGKLIRDLHDATDIYKNADLTVVSMSTSLETIQWAWGRIQAILETWTDEQSCASQKIDTDTFHQLERSLKGGRIVIAALEEDLLPLAAASLQDHGAATGSRILNRVQIVWNAKALREHQERIRDQVNSMNLMVSVLKLPSATTRQASLDANMNILRKSDESACTVAPSTLSAVTPSLRSREDDSVVSEVSESSLVYRELAIDDDLFSARVYKRNYRVDEVRGVEPKVKTESSPNKALRNFSTPRITRSDGTTSATKPATTMMARLSITPSQVIQDKPLPDAGLSQIVTGWLVLSDFDDSYTAIPGPKVSKIFFDGEGLSEWKTSQTEYPKLDGDYWLSTIEGLSDWKTSPTEYPKLDGDYWLSRIEELFDFFVDKPMNWLYHCLMAASAMDRENVVRMILEEDPYLSSKARNSYSSRRPPPVELAFQHGHIHVVKHLLRSSCSALYDRPTVGARIIRHAVHEHDTELLSLILTQTSIRKSLDVKKPFIRLEHRDSSD